METNVTEPDGEPLVSRSTLHRLNYLYGVANAPDGAVPDQARRVAGAVFVHQLGDIRGYYEAVRYIVEAGTVRSWKCAQCDGEMTDRDHRSDARYCSGACRQKAYRARRSIAG